MLRRLACPLVMALAVLGQWGSYAAADTSPYPSTPFALQAPPTAVYLPFAFGAPSEFGDEIWVAMRGRALAVVPRRDGSLAQRRATTLPADVAPTSIASSGDLDFYLDAARSRVLVYDAEGLRQAPARTLAVGPEPSGIVAGSGSSDGSYVMAANAGDLSMYTSRHGFAFGPERRIRVGLRPTAILLLDLDETIAVANTGSGTVSEFTSPEAFDGFGRLPDVTVGGTPSALVVADSFAADLNDDATDDLVVGDTSRGVVTQLLSLGRSPWFTRGPVFASGPVDAMAVGNLDRDRHPDLAVTDRGRGRVLVLRGTRGNGFGAPAVVASGVDPVAMLAGQFGGDYQDDLLVADARTSSLRLLLTPGDRLLSAGRPAREVVAVGHERLLWSEQTRRRRHRLVLWSAGSAQRLPVRPSERPLVARTGRVQGHRAVSYVRCRADRCRPFAWDLERGREHRLRLPAHPGCTVRAVAVWNRTAAFELAGLGCRAPGLWIRRRGHKARRVSATGELGALRGGRLAFRAKDRSRFIWRIRVTGRRGRVRTLDRTALDLSAPRIVGRFAYWTKSDDFDPPTLVRTRIDRPTSCWESWPRRRSRAVGLNRRGDFEAADFAVHGERLFYADRLGVFEVEPERIRWHRSCRR